MEKPQIVERGKGRTGRLRNRSVCGYVGVVCVPFFCFWKRGGAEVGKGSQDMPIREVRAVRGKEEGQRQRYSAAVSTAAGIQS